MSNNKTNSHPEHETKPAFKKSHISMHEDVDETNDGCCSCEAEPYWTEAMEATDELSTEHKKKD